MSKGGRSVRPLVSSRDGVFCSACWEEMAPEEYREVVKDEDGEPMTGRPWLFWRCKNGHVTEMLPLP